MRQLAIVVVVILLPALPGCKKRHSYIDYSVAEYADSGYYYGDTDVEADSEIEAAESVAAEEPSMPEDVIVIPFQRSGGVKYVEAEINGSIGVRMIVDTGCSTTMISLAEARYLAEKGALAIEDFQGEQASVIADGSITVNSVVTLRQLAIKGINGEYLYCGNVTAIVSDNPQAPLLLGNSILDRAGGYAIDNANGCIIFKIE